MDKEEKLLLDIALKQLGLRRCKVLLPCEVYTMRIYDKDDKSQDIEHNRFEAYDNYGEWINSCNWTDSIETIIDFGRIRWFFRFDCPAVYPTKERYKWCRENIFFGVKSLEELAVKLDLLGINCLSLRSTTLDNALVKSDLVAERNGAGC